MKIFLILVDVNDILIELLLEEKISTVKSIVYEFDTTNRRHDKKNT